ncbi:MAG: hypothetical protein OHK003_32370 [Anaerolineales bacterium]
MAKTENQFIFNISLSILNHLGRNLYRSFMTVLGEAISNAWDADAENVWIYIDREKGSLVVKDDGVGMDANDFQDKFLKIGYSKRKEGSRSAKNRPYIGRKGIGKIALLSCAKRIGILTRKSIDVEYVGGVIDNSGLEEAIKDDLTPDRYPLGKVNETLFQQYKERHAHGTIIYFEDINEGVKNNIEQIRKMIALYFRFSLIDDSFKIHVDDVPISLDDLDDLAKNTMFLWNINELSDPYLRQNLIPPTLLEQDSIPAPESFKGFIASVRKPRNLKIFTTEEKVGVDLFVNGRLRERDILRHIPSAGVYESYLYGQIHFDELDDDITDRFTSSREGVIADDAKFTRLLYLLRDKIMRQIADQWDEWRLKHKEEGDDENPRLSPRARKSRALFNVVSEDYSLPDASAQKGKVDKWVNGLAQDAQFNFSSYAECFISENLVRKFIEEEQITLSPEAERERDKWKRVETDSKNRANISIDIRRSNSGLSYLSMDDLANLVDKVREPLKQAGLSRDAIEYKPMRDAIAHTALLTDLAKNRLTAVYENIKARIRTLLSSS